MRVSFRSRSAEKARWEFGRFDRTEFNTDGFDAFVSSRRLWTSWFQSKPFSNIWSRSTGTSKSSRFSRRCFSFCSGTLSPRREVFPSAGEFLNQTHADKANGPLFAFCRHAGSTFKLLSECTRRLAFGIRTLSSLNYVFAAELATTTSVFLKLVYHRPRLRLTHARPVQTSYQFSFPSVRFFFSGLFRKLTYSETKIFSIYACRFSSFSRN